MRRLILLVLLPAVFMPPAVGAADISKREGRQRQTLPTPPSSPWSGYIGAGAAYMPEFPGSKDYEIKPVVRARLAYDQYYIELTGPRAKINVIPGGVIEAGPMIGYDGGRDNKLKNRRVRLLPKVDSSAEFGAFANLNFDNVITARDKVEFGVEFVKASSGHKGYVATVRANYGLQIAAPLFVSVDASLEFADKKYSSAYFGVTRIGSQASGLSVFTPSAGLTEVEVGANARYMFNRSWGITGRLAYGRLVGDAAKSPIVKREGSENQVLGAIAAIYRF